MPLIAVRANSEEGVFEAKAERNNSTLIIKWAPFIWARWGAPSICPSSLSMADIFCTLMARPNKNAVNVALSRCERPPTRFRPGVPRYFR